MIRVSIENHPRSSTPDEARWSCFDQETTRRASGWCESEAAARRSAARMGWEIIEDSLFALEPQPARIVSDERGSQGHLGF
jgi:hypothetical protein